MSDTAVDENPTDAGDNIQSELPAGLPAQADDLDSLLAEFDAVTNKPEPEPAPDNTGQDTYRTRNWKSS